MEGDMVKLPRHEYGLYLAHNEHKDCYMTVKQWLDDYGACYDWCGDNAARDRAIETNELWTLRWYPKTPIGFYSIAAPTLKELLALAERLDA